MTQSTRETVEFIDQTVRDGQQSLWGMKMTHRMMEPVLPWLDRSGYRVIDYSGGAMIKVAVKNLKQDPWRAMREATSAVETPMRAAVRGDGILMAPVPDALQDLFVERLVANGIRSFWVFDVLLHEERVRRVTTKAKSLGVEVVGTVFFTDSPVHTDEYYRGLAATMATMPVDAIYLEDTAGVLTPERARTLVAAVQEGAGDLPLEVHFHNTTGMAPACYVEALRLGVRTIHTAVPPMADSGSLPNVGHMLKLVDQLGLTSHIDTEHLGPVGEHLRFVGEREGFLLGGPTELDLDVYRHQIPGGMMGTLKRQLAELGLSDRLGEILEETAIVRRELGYPGMATPLSQFAGIQAALNLLTGERYKQVPVEVVRYVCGYYGDPVGPLDQDVVDRVMQQPLARSGAGASIEQLSLDEIRAEHGSHLSDDDLILHAVMSSEEIEEMRRAPLEAAYPQPMTALMRRLTSSGSTHHASCRTDGLAMTLERSAPTY